VEGSHVGENEAERGIGNRSVGKAREGAGSGLVLQYTNTEMKFSNLGVVLRLRLKVMYRSRRSETNAIFESLPKLIILGCIDPK
jgi:hypothetical protein